MLFLRIILESCFSTVRVCKKKHVPNYCTPKCGYMALKTRSCMWEVQSLQWLEQQGAVTHLICCRTSQAVMAQENEYWWIYVTLPWSDGKLTCGSNQGFQYAKIKSKQGPRGTKYSSNSKLSEKCYCVRKLIYPNAESRATSDPWTLAYWATF